MSDPTPEVTIHLFYKPARTAVVEDKTVHLKPQVIVAKVGTAISGATKLTEFKHPSNTDTQGWWGSHAMVQHIREELYKRKPDGTTGFWPDNITDLAQVDIVYKEDL